MNKDLQAIKNEMILGKEFCIYGDKDNPLFLAKDVAEMIEHSNVSKMLSNIDEDEKQLIQIGTLTNSYSAWFLTEYGLYEVLMQSRKPIAKQFKKEVKEILKQLRMTGVVITESATEEAIDYQAKYGRYRIRKTFNESTDLRATYEEYAKLSKLERDAKRIDNKDRIKNCKTILDVIETKLAENVTTMRGSEVLALRELALDIQSDITRLHNKANGGIKSAQTKRIQQLEQELLNADTQDELDWKTIGNHGFTENLRLEYSHQLKRMVRTRAYNAWRNNFDYSDCRPLNCDTSKPMIIYLHFGKLAKFDTSNLEKSAIDMISEYYGFNDNLIISKITTSEIVSTYKDGFIMFDLINESDDNED